MRGAEHAIVIVPTYWTWPSHQSARPTTAAYDHPTPLDGESTLPPLLQELAAQTAAPSAVLILLGLAHPDLADPASQHLRELLEPFRARLNLLLCDAATVGQLIETLKPNETETNLFHLNSYPGIRNLQLLLPQVLGAEVVIALDDDERVEPDFVQRAIRYIGQMKDGARVLGLAGPYLQPEGGALLQERPATGNALQDKARHINAAMRGLTESKAGLVPSPMALGGNMVFHRDLFTRVCFDPGITRGEDIDYLINARLGGIRWWFDPELTVLHVPPRHLETPAYQRTREDVYRFIYEREKLRLHGQRRPAWLEPYPAALLGSALEEHARVALQADATPELVERLGSPEAIVQAAREHAKTNARRYPEFVRAWRGLLERAEGAEVAFPRL